MLEAEHNLFIETLRELPTIDGCWKNTTPTSLKPRPSRSTSPAKVD